MRSQILRSLPADRIRAVHRPLWSPRLAHPLDIINVKNTFQFERSKINAIITDLL